jgi:hypothetical protein
LAGNTSPASKRKEGPGRTSADVREYGTSRKTLHEKEAHEIMKEKESKIYIDRVRMKWKVVSFWYVVFLSIFTISGADDNTKWKSFCTLPSFFKTNNGISSACNEFSIVAYNGPDETNKKSNECFLCLRCLRGGAAAISFPSGYNPFGYGLTDLGKQYLGFNGSPESDIGRFLSTLKSGRKKEATIKEQWLEIVRVSKQGQNMRIYRSLDDLIKFCLSAGFID